MSCCFLCYIYLPIALLPSCHHAHSQQHISFRFLVLHASLTKHSVSLCPRASVCVCCPLIAHWVFCIFLVLCIAGTLVRFSARSHLPPPSSIPYLFLFLISLFSFTSAYTPTIHDVWHKLKAEVKVTLPGGEVLAASAETPYVLPRKSTVQPGV